MKLLLDEIRNSKNCIVLPSTGLPSINTKHVLPRDVVDFYSECGGIKFFTDSDYTIDIVPANKVQLSNSIILPEGWEVDIPSDDMSNHWYIIAEAGSEQKISIDLSNERAGKCYDSFWDIHASPGESPILAVSFTELLMNIFKCQGDYWFWLADDFSDLGDAYDNQN